MQHPKYSFNANQSNGAPAEGYSVFQNNSSFIDSQLNSLTSSQRSAKASPKSSTVKQQNAFTGKTHNFSDQPATTWQWSPRQQNTQPALPLEDPPRVEQVPANVQSFAPPANLGQLQRVERPQIQHEQQFASDIYKSPIDRPYVGRPRNAANQLEATAESNEGLDGATPYTTAPERDEVTEVKEFLPRTEATEALFAEPSLPEAAPSNDKQVIVLRSQSPEELAKARAKEANSQKPNGHLLTPNFESYVGSPVIDTTLDVYQDQTQWKAYVPKPAEAELPPPAIFVSLPKDTTPEISVKSAAVDFSPPAPTNHVFESAEEVAALPEPPPAPAPRVEQELFQAPPAPAKAENVFGTASAKVKSTPKTELPAATQPVENSYWNNTPVNQVSPSKVQVKQPSYRLERYESSTDVAANTTAMTVAHTTPVAPAVKPEPAWLSPWWMLVCLVPFAMYLMTRSDSTVDQYCDEISDHPRLPPEMIGKPGYSKSDAIYGEKDEYFATEQLYAKFPHALPAERLPMATHLKAAGHSGENIEEFSLTENVTQDSVSELDFAISNSVQTDNELDGNASPNFRSQVFEADADDDDIPEWLR